MSNTRYLTCAETAKLVRADLNAAFPGVRFTVRSSNYSGGASIRVAWENGPTEDAVSAITCRFAGSGYDGQADMKTSRPPMQMDTSSGTPALVHSGADYVFTRRELAGEYVTRLDAIIAQRLGTNPDAWPAWIEDFPTDFGFFQGGPVGELRRWLSRHIPA